MPRMRLANASWELSPRPDSEPPEFVVSAAERAGRRSALRDRARQTGLDALAVFGDREHCGNLTYLTGYDPRFDEALLIVPSSGDDILIVGTENLEYAENFAPDIEVRQAAEFSLPGQPTTGIRPLAEVLAQSTGVAGAKVGIVGWKPLASSTEGMASPHFVVEAIRSARPNEVADATALLMNPRSGLRRTASAAQIVEFEWTVRRVSHAMRRVIEGARPGMSEIEIAAEAGISGLPLSAHMMFSSGRETMIPLSSPGIRRVQLGDPVFSAIGGKGSLTARGGMLATGGSQLSGESASYLGRFAAPYYGLLVERLSKLDVGARAGDVVESVEAEVAHHDFRLALNAGHTTDWEEWMNSPFYPESDIDLESGSLLQMDLIPAGSPDWFVANGEDTLILADDHLRAELQKSAPAAYQRMLNRQRRLRETVGVDVADAVLPLSDTLGWWAPLWLSPDLIYQTA